MALRPLGFARVLKDDRTGRLVVDKSSMRRRIKKKRRFSGDETEGDFEGRRRRRRRRARRRDDDDDMGSDDYGDDDTGDDEAGDDYGDDEAGDDLGDDDEAGDDLGADDDEAGDDDYGDDEAGDDEAGDDEAGDDDLGADGDDEQRPERRGILRRRRRRQRRKNRRQRRRGRKHVRWGKTALSGESNTPDNAGDQITINIRPQHWFRAQDITFTGDASAKVDTIFFGDRPIWNNSVGTPVAVFASTGMLRGILNGQKIRPGLDIIIKGTSGTAATRTTATLIGYKPLNTTC